MRVSVDSEAIEDEAARWFARRDSGNWTNADQQAFDDWLASSLAHRIAYIRIAAAWKRAARMKALGAGVPPGTIPLRGSWADVRFSSGRSTKMTAGAVSSDKRTLAARSAVDHGNGKWKSQSRRLRVAVIAASLFAAVFSGIYVYIADAVAGDRFTTPVGGMKTIRLSDGSRVTLNTDTRIRVLLGKKERRVDLVKGEAFFEVAKDATDPFIVYAGDNRVRAIGTAFSVRRNSDDVEVVVAEGRVQLTTAPSLLSTLEADRSRSGKVEDSATEAVAPSVAFLRAGSIAGKTKSQVIVREQAALEAEEALRWRAGYIVFRNTTLEQAVAEFNRYNTRKILIEDPSISTILIGGDFHPNNTEAFLALIQGGFPIRVEEDGDRVILRGR
jgi:transmembrane sensor